VRIYLFGSYPIQNILLRGFLLPISDRRDGRSPTVASRGNPYYGKDAEIGKGVAKLVPLHRTTGETSGSNQHLVKAHPLFLGRAETAHQTASKKLTVSEG